MPGGTDAKPVVLITGCSAEGLGESLALAFHAKGFRVFATARSLSSMKSLHEVSIETFELDVTEAESIVAARGHVERLTGGKLDVLVNNAGQSYPFAVSDASMDQKFLPLLLASNNACIVQMGSFSGVMPTPFGIAYNASKAALHSLSDTLRLELAPFNIKVINVVLGNVKTQITKPWHRLPQGSIYEPISDIYHSRRIANFMANAYPRESVAETIVTEVLKRKPRAWLWGGHNAWLVWFIHTFLGRRGFDGILSRIFGLSKLAAILKARVQDKKRR